MKKQRIFWILTLSFFALQIVAELMLGISVARLDMLPNTYWWLFVCVLGVLALGIGVLGLFRLPNKHVSVVRRCIAAVMSLLIAIGCFFVWKATEQVYATIEEIVATDPTVPSRAVFVRVEDQAVTLDDTKGYVYGITTDYDAESCSNVRMTLEECFGVSLTVSEFQGATAMVDALLNGQVDAIILNSGYLTVMEEQEKYQDIMVKLRLVEQIPLVERQTSEESGSAQQPTTQPTEPAIEDKTENTPFIIYFSGLDVRGKKLSVSRSDVNILAVVNPNTKQILLVNTPRDYYVAHPDSAYGTKDKLTHLGIYGIECSVKGLEMLYGIHVDYYAQVNFSGFEALIDAVGGITVYSDHSFTAYDDFVVPAYIQKGVNNFNGREALVFARDRYHQPAGDNDRGKNQMKVIQAVISKVTSASTIVANYSEVLSSMSGMFKTSIPMDVVSSLVKTQLSDMASWSVQTYAVTGTGGSSTTYSMPDFRAYVTYPNEDSVAFASDLINRVLSGEKLTDDSVKFPQ